MSAGDNGSMPASAPDASTCPTPVTESAGPKTATSAGTDSSTASSIETGREAVGQRIAFTIFPSLTSPEKLDQSMSWTDLATKMWNATVEQAKTNSPLIKLATFGNHIPPGGKLLRNEKNLLEVTGIEGDYDGKVVGIIEAKQQLERHSIKAILYTSWSHEPAAPRWRVLCPLSKPVGPDERDHCVRRLNGALGGILAQESFVLAQAFFFGRRDGAEYKCEVTFDDPEHDEAECIDLLDDLDQIAVPYTKEGACNGAQTPTAAAAGAGMPATQDRGHENWLADLLDGDNVHGNALRVVGRMVAKGLDDATIEAVFESFWDTIAKSRGEERAEALIAAPELDRMIAGARNKGFAPMTGEESKAKMQEFVSRINVASIPDIQEIIKDIAAASFNASEPGLLLGALKQKFGRGASIVDLRSALKIEQAKLARAAGRRVEGEEEPDQTDLARGVITDLGFGNAIFAQDRFWLWDEKGVWRAADDKEIKQIVQRSLKDADDLEVNASLVGGVTECIKHELFVAAAPFEQTGKDNVVNVTNGTLEWTDREWRLREHRRDDHLLTQLPVPFDPEAKAPRFEQFLDEVFEGDGDADDKKAAVLEMIGYTLLPTCRHEKFALLVGEGANGKSVLLDVVGALLGPKLVAGVQPSQFENKFQRAHLHGKLANLVTELQEGATIPEDQLKGIVSGELTTAEHKNRDPFDFMPYATCWFGTNHMPQTRDFSRALYRRAVILTFNQSFEGREDKHLKERLRGELPGILALALRAYADVMARGHITIPGSSEVAGKKWRESTDLVEQFVDECCETGPSPNFRENSAELYTAARKWAEDGGITRFPSRRGFVDRIKRREFGTPGEHGKANERVVFGLRLREGYRASSVPPSR